VAIRQDNVNRYQDISEVYPWTEDMVKGKGGSKGVRSQRSLPGMQIPAQVRVSEKQKKAITRGT
jgi:hypothetical protein